MVQTIFFDLTIVDEIRKVGKAPIIELLDSYGGWPIITPHWDENKFDWRKASSSLRNQLRIHSFFNIATSIDLDDEDKTIIKV